MKQLDQRLSFHCCEEIEANTKPIYHEDGSSCPDQLLEYNKRFDEYGILIHDGGTSSLQIQYCPWCGAKLPESKRDLWFETLFRLGFDEPSEQPIPKSFQTDEWYRTSKD